MPGLHVAINGALMYLINSFADFIEDLYERLPPKIVSSWFRPTCSLKYPSLHTAVSGLFHAT
jgi:hypothetical protein